MAELMMPQKNGKRKIHSLRIDLTPMVDLGFLLITFFMLTTTMARPNSMEINMPTDEPTDEPTTFISEATVTFIPTKDHTLSYYFGALGDNSKMQYTSMQKAREIIQRKKSQVAALPDNFSKNAHLLHVIIKPSNSCKYEDVVSLLDEMNINDVRYYAIADLNEAETALIK